MKQLILFTLVLTVSTCHIYAQNTTPWPATGDIGIGTVTPLAPLHVQSATAIATGRFYGNVRSTTGGGGVILGQYMNGTATANTHRLGTLSFAGVTTTANMTSSASVSAFAEGNFTATSLPTSLRFFTTPVNSTAYAERLRIMSTGNIGMGTTAPAALLHLEAAETAPLIAVNTSASSTTSGALLGGFVNATPSGVGHRLGGFQMGSRAGGAQLYAGLAVAGYAEAAWTAGTSHPSYMAFETVSSGSITRAERMRISAAGNVGIGATAPAALLHTQGTAVTQIMAVNTTAGGAGSGAVMSTYMNATPTAAGHRLGGLTFGSRAGGAQLYNGIAIVGYAEAAWTAGTSHPSYMTFETNPSGSATRAERMRITAAGNVGIGVTAPAFPLHISSATTNALAIQSTAALSASSGAFFRGYNTGVPTAADLRLGGILFGSTNSGSNYTGVQMEAMSEGAWTAGSSYPSSLRILTTSSGSASPTEKVRITAAGNVGIGTTDTKGYRLAVNGTAIFTKVTVKPYGNWPDYVFADTYQLPALAEVATYITTHRHLPGVVSAQEVATNGLDLGDNQAVLLKKIEELTLYAIEQDKKIAALLTAVEQLKQAVTPSH